MSTLYLSRLRLNREPSVAALEGILVPDDDGVRAGVAHQLIWTAFADHSDRKRDFLWRQDDRRGWLVLSHRPPDNRHGLFQVETKPFAPHLDKGQRLAFALRANAVVTRKDAKGRPKRSDVVMDRLRAIPPGERAPARERIAAEAAGNWLVAQGVVAGFGVNGIDVLAYRTEMIPRKGKRGIELGVLDLEGEIRVERPDAFLMALGAGLGKAKAFGCGLMLIRPSR